MDNFTNLEVEKVFNNYPDTIKAKMLFLRQLILDQASDENKIEETLKWGEPSYLMEGGSTVRIDWKHTSPEQYAMYFNCQTKLVDTFKELYRFNFKFEKNRAIIFNVNEEIAVEELEHCVYLSLNYHKIKHLPMLGA